MLALVVLLNASLLHGKSKDEAIIASQSQHPVVEIPRVDHPPKLEDFLGMAPAPGAPAMAKIDNFIQNSPKDGAQAQEKTEVYIGYDAKNFYAVFVCFDKDPGKIRARLTHREDISSDHDEVQVYLDTFNDKRRAYGFMINPIGVQLDYIWTENNGYDNSFDTVWDSKGKVTEQGYVGFMAIPFKSLRFPSTPQQTWGILFQRVVPHDNDSSFYPHVSTKIQGRLNQEAELHGLQNINPGRNIQLMPYAVADSFRVLDQRDPSRPLFTDNHLGGTAGMDAKIILKDSLVLDLTYNPDFRQVESDQPQNLVNQRFEVFFPEKRPFFQENANFFDSPINLYFTRRISDPEYGLRLTGKTGPYGIGILVSDDRGPGLSVPSYDPLFRQRAYFAIARFTRDLWKQSHIGVFFADREMDARVNSICTNNINQLLCTARNNRVGGADFRLHFGDHFHVEGQGVMSSTHVDDGSYQAGPSFQLYQEYSSRRIEFNSVLEDTSGGFANLTGFFRRPDYRRTSSYINYQFHPEGRVLTRVAPYVFQFMSWDHSGTELVSDYELGANVNLKASTNFGMWHGIQKETLRPHLDFDALTRNTGFNEGYNGFNFNSSYFKLVQFNGFINWDQGVNYNPLVNVAPFPARETSANMTVTVHPLNRLTVDNSYILERLRTIPTNQAIVNSHVIRSKFNYQYNKELSFRVIMQYDGNLVNQRYSTIDPQKNFNVDFLASYLLHPGTAFYIGYNSNLENLDPMGISSHTGVFRTNRSYINDGRTIFAKISYLLRF